MSLQRETVNKLLSEHMNVVSAFIYDDDNIHTILDIVDEIIRCFAVDGKILVCGNGGSAADSQHFIAELISKFESERRSLPCIALTTNTSTITATANDYSFDRIFSRQVEGLAEPNDVVIGITTSGNSINVINALSMAIEKGARTIALTGSHGGKIINTAGITLKAPSDNTARIQEVHELVIHIVCKLVEEHFVNIAKTT